MTEPTIKTNFERRALFLPGADVYLAGVHFVAPALALGQLKRLQPTLDALDEIGKTGKLTVADAEGLARVIHASLSRNYVIELDDVIELADVVTAGQAIRAILTGSGMVKPEGAAPGEA